MIDHEKRDLFHRLRDAENRAAQLERAVKDAERFIPPDRWQSYRLTRRQP